MEGHLRGSSRHRIASERKTFWLRKGISLPKMVLLMDFGFEFELILINLDKFDVNYLEKFLGILFIYLKFQKSVKF